MINFEFEEIKPNVYRLIIKDSNSKILDIYEREDYRSTRIAKISLFGLIGNKRLSFDNTNIDRFLFL